MLPKSGYYQIFDGDDFITEYEMRMDPPILGFIGNKGDKTYHFDDEALNYSVNFASKDKTVMDNAWFLLKEAEHFLDLGKYEISLINMAILVEMLVTSALERYLDNQGHFKGSHSKNIREKYGGSASFTEKYFLYGLKLITDIELPEDILNGIDFIYKVRNDLAHGKMLYGITLIKDNEINEFNTRMVWFDLMNTAIEVYNFFYDLNLDH